MQNKINIEEITVLDKNRKYVNTQQLIKLLPSFLESMIISAELAAFNVNGFKGTIRLKGLMIVYFPPINREILLYMFQCILNFECKIF